jgi:hypothetical protein
VQLAQHGQRGEAACGGLVRGRQMVQMEQVGRVRTGAREQLDPGSDEPFVAGIVDGGKDAIGRTRAILVGGLEGNGRGQRGGPVRLALSDCEVPRSHPGTKRPVLGGTREEATRSEVAKRVGLLGRRRRAKRSDWKNLPRPQR